MLLLALVTLVFHWGAIFTPEGQALPGSDFEEIHYPLLHFVVDSVQTDGVIPLWNPHQFLGYSVVGNPQYGLFYPPNWLLLLYGTVGIYAGVGLLVGLHTFWLALGMVLLARRWGANWWAATLAGLVLAFGGYPASKIYAGHYAVFLAIAWTPWILAGYTLAVQKRQFQWVLPGGTALGLGLMAGHPQMMYITGFGLGLGWLYFVWQAENSQRRWLATRQLLLVGIIGAVLGAVTWLPALDYSSKTARGNVDNGLEFADEHAVPPEQFSTWLVPDVFGAPLEDEDEPVYWGESFYEEMTAYVGLLPLLCLLLLPGLRRPETVFWLGLLLFGLWMSLGNDGGLYWLVNSVLPPAQSFRAPGRFWLLSSIGLAGMLATTLTILSQMGVTERRRGLRRLLAGGLGLAVLLIGLSLLVIGPLDEGGIESERAVYAAEQLASAGLMLFLLSVGMGLWAARQRGLTLIGVGLVALVAVGDVARMSVPLTRVDTVGLSPVWQEAAQHIPQGEAAGYGRVMQMSAMGIPNGASWTGHQSPQGYDPIVPEEWSALVDATGPFINDPGSATNRLFGVRYALAATDIQNYGFGDRSFFERVAQPRDFFFYENPLPLGRIYMPQQLIIEEDMARARGRILAGEVDRGDMVLLETMPACELGSANGQATISHYSANEVVIDVFAEDAVLLVLSDQYDEDWQVTIGENEVELLRANTLLRAVCVPAGEHEVRFSYQPLAWQIGGGVSLVGWLLVLLGSAWQIGRAANKSSYKRYANADSG